MISTLIGLLFPLMIIGGLLLLLKFVKSKPSKLFYVGYILLKILLFALLLFLLKDFIVGSLVSFLIGLGIGSFIMFIGMILIVMKMTGNKDIQSKESLK